MNYQIPFCVEQGFITMEDYIRLRNYQKGNRDMYTEEEARNKQCVDPREIWDAWQRLSFSRYQCVASGCMAWRWVSSKIGYCGLAGRVEQIPREKEDK